MTSTKQRIANRANAQKSTGPRTPEGKEASRRNALVHGCRASTVLLDDEDEERFQALRVGLAEELEPKGILEAETVERLAGLVWRCRRIAVFEAAVLAWMNHWSAEYYTRQQVDRGWSNECERRYNFQKGLNLKDKTRSPDDHSKLVLGRLLREEMNHNLIAKLSRYEAHLLNQTRRTYQDLQELQARRGAVAEPDLPPGPERCAGTAVAQV